MRWPSVSREQTRLRKQRYNQRNERHVKARKDGKVTLKLINNVAKLEDGAAGVRNDADGRRCTTLFACSSVSTFVQYCCSCEIVFSLALLCACPPGVLITIFSYPCLVRQLHQPWLHFPLLPCIASAGFRWLSFVRKDATSWQAPNIRKLT